MKVSDANHAEILNVDDNSLPSLTQWLWVTMAVLSAGLVLLAGRLIANPRLRLSSI
jgi:hypothetical protein